MPRFAGFSLAEAIEQVAPRQVIQLTFSELCAAYAAAHPCDSLSRLKKWCEALGNDSAWGIDRDTFARAGEAMAREGYSPSSVNRDLSAIGSVYKWAHHVQKITPADFRSPTRDIPRITETPRVVTVDANLEMRIRALSLAFPDRRFGLFVNLMLDTGARPSEVLERRWDELNLEDCKIVLPANAVKTKRARTLIFSSTTADLARRICPAKTRRTELVFAGRKGGIKEYRKAWHSLREKVGRPDLHVYDLRHVAAANLLASGASVSKASQVLGNSSLILHRRYGHLEDRSMQEAQSAAWKDRVERAGQVAAIAD